MPQQTTEKRETAKRLYLESGGKILLKDIASQLETPPSTVSSWKRSDKWDSFLKRKPRKNARLLKGNKRSAKPHPSQLNNKNPLVHGRYEQLKYATMTDEEKSLIDEVRASTDQIKMQVDLIAELEVRERRMYARIEALRLVAEKDPERLVTNFATLETESAAEADKPKKKAKPGTMRVSKAKRHVTDLIQEIENALTAVQKQKQQAILTLHKLTEDKIIREREERRLQLEERRVQLLERRLALSDPDIETDAMREAKRLLEGIESAF